MRERSLVELKALAAHTLSTYQDVFKELKSSVPLDKRKELASEQNKIDQSINHYINSIYQAKNKEEIVTILKEARKLSDELKNFERMLKASKKVTNPEVSKWEKKDSFTKKPIDLNDKAVQKNILQYVLENRYAILNKARITGNPEAISFKSIKPNKANPEKFMDIIAFHLVFKKGIGIQLGDQITIPISKENLEMFAREQMEKMAKAPSVSLSEHRKPESISNKIKNEVEDRFKNATAPYNLLGAGKSPEEGRTARNTFIDSYLAYDDTIKNQILNSQSRKDYQALIKSFQRKITEAQNENDVNKLELYQKEISNLEKLISNRNQEIQDKSEEDVLNAANLKLDDIINQARKSLFGNDPANEKKYEQAIKNEIFKNFGIEMPDGYNGRVAAQAYKGQIYLFKVDEYNELRSSVTNDTLHQLIVDKKQVPIPLESLRKYADSQFEFKIQRTARYELKQNLNQLVQEKYTKIKRPQPKEEKPGVESQVTPKFK